MEMRRVGFTDLIFGILTEIKHFGYEVNQEVNICLVYRVIGKIQKSDVDESVPEFVQKFRASSRGVEERIIKDRNCLEVESHRLDVLIYL